MNSKKKYLTIEEKKTLAMEGKDVPLCAYDESFISKIKRKMEQRKKAKIFSKNILRRKNHVIRFFRCFKNAME